ncbi:hypothetical protein Salat_2596900 [Sesamum alatum]|uniref:LYR motif containing domain-containing protein n=1 Tax=Sesamum alatum TaxID=300844 RepID=A0AAE1XNT2_9LAMI|nr:hypothetical protein Salat_2596900 [Sesamum alatum]
MAKGLIWATAEDMTRHRGQVLSLYRQILRSLNSPDLPLNLAATLTKKAEARAIFLENAPLNGDRSMGRKEDSRPIKIDAEIKEIGGEGSQDGIILEGIRVESLISEINSNGGVLEGETAADKATRVN